MGCEEMLEQQDRKRLAKAYVEQGLFGKKLRGWVANGGGSGLQTTQEVRRMIGEVLIFLDATMSEITEVALQVTASRDAEYGGRTKDWWYKNTDSDIHFKNVLFELLDCMVVIVEAGNEAQYAWIHVKTCVQEDESGVWKLSRKRLDEMVKFLKEFEEEKAKLTKKPQRVSFGDGRRREMTELLDRLKELS